MKLRVGDFSKLIALEARYHKTCHNRYIVHSEHTEHDDSPYSLCSARSARGYLARPAVWPCTGHELCPGKVPGIAHAVHSTEGGLMHTRQKLKFKLQTKCADQIQIHHGSFRGPDIVTSASLQLQDIINTIAHQKKMLKELQIEKDVSVPCENLSPQLLLFHAALILRSHIRSAEEISAQPLNPADVSRANSNIQVHDKLYTFLHWVLCSKSP